MFDAKALITSSIVTVRRTASGEGAGVVRIMPA